MKQCTITHEGETCIVVWLRMPPINNLFFQKALAQEMSSQWKECSMQAL